MKALELLLHVCKTQLFTQIPREHRADFRVSLCSANMPRFATMSFVLVFMDIATLTANLFYYRQMADFSVWNLLVLLVKIFVNIWLFLWMSGRQGKKPDMENPLVRNIEVLYPVLHSAGETFLFITGPQDMGALIRYLAVPFIMGSIPIIQQVRVLAMDTVFYAVQTIYIARFTSYAAFIYHPSYFINIWLVVVVCAVLVSNIVYSAYVNNYMAAVKQGQIQQELKNLNTRLDIMSRHDPLTGLSNRRDFELYMETTWKKGYKGQRVASAIMVDIDYFKRFNDYFGHLVGDNCLVQVTRSIQDCLLGYDAMLARYGGEEFIVITYGEKHGRMVALAEMMRESVEALQIENPESDVSPYVTISCGLVSRRVGDVEDYRTIVKTADDCLYYAKQNGRNQLVQLDVEDHRYRDAKGKILDEAQQRELGGIELLHSPLFRRAAQGISNECTFSFSREKDTLVFSEYAQQTLRTPAVVQGPHLQKVVDLLPIAPEDRGHIIEFFRKTFANKAERAETELRVVTEQEQKLWVSISIQCAYSEEGSLQTMTGSFFSIRSILEYSSYAQEQAMVDSITRLANRRKFHSDMRQVLMVENGYGYLVLFDVRNFKILNRMYSHNIGDKILAALGPLLQRLIPADATVYHYAVDQFVVLLRAYQHDQTAQFIERVQRYFAARDVDVEGLEIKISFSTGAIEYGPSRDDLDELMVDLDIAVQKAKHEAGNHIRFFRQEDKTEYIERLNLEIHLTDAVQKGFAGFSLHYQPLVEAETGQCVGAEALLRWRTADGHEVPPARVVPLLEKSGLITPVGRWILNTACGQCKRWIAGGADAEFFVHVNLSVMQIDGTSFVDEVFRTLKRNGLGRQNLVLEVTEGAFVSETAYTINALQALHQAGIKIAVDDFGTGYSSLSYLRALPADEIKIDKSFLQGIETDESAQQILASIVDLSKGMRYMVCVEGVETPGQLAFLESCAVDFFQGYLLGRPVTASAFKRKWLPQSVGLIDDERDAADL